MEWPRIPLEDDPSDVRSISSHSGSPVFVVICYGRHGGTVTVGVVIATMLLSRRTARTLRRPRTAAN